MDRVVGVEVELEVEITIITKVEQIRVTVREARILVVGMPEGPSHLRFLPPAVTPKYHPIPPHKQHRGLVEAIRPQHLFPQ